MLCVLPMSTLALLVICRSVARCLRGQPTPIALTSTWCGLNCQVNITPVNLCAESFIAIITESNENTFRQVCWNMKLIIENGYINAHGMIITRFTCSINSSSSSSFCSPFTASSLTSAVQLFMTNFCLCEIQPFIREESDLLLPPVTIMVAKRRWPLGRL